MEWKNKRQTKIVTKFWYIGVEDISNNFHIFKKMTGINEYKYLPKHLWANINFINIWVLLLLHDVTVSYIYADTLVIKDSAFYKGIWKNF